MRGRFHVNQDFESGMMFVGWGVAGLWIGRDYPMGSALRRGPGYLPRLLCWGLVILGLAIAIKGATLAMLLPATFYLPPVPALIMLAGIYYGAQYGGSTTAILVNMPGESSSVVTCLDGYQMARKGRAGAALAIAALGSLFAGTVST